VVGAPLCEFKVGEPEVVDGLAGIAIFLTRPAEIGQEFLEPLLADRPKEFLSAGEVVVGGPGGDAGILGDASQRQGFSTCDALERMAKQRLFKLTVVLSNSSQARSPWHGVR
jgi:hypothetical protein